MKKIALFSLLAVLSGLLLVYLGIRHTAIESISRSDNKLRIAKKKVGKHNVTIIRGVHSRSKATFS